MDALFFWLFSAGMIGFGLSVILNRNPVASALCFAFTIVFMSGLFVMLSAFFLAAVQILVTAGAVMVLFLFIIMLLDLTAMEHMPRQKIWMGCTVIVALGFLYLVALTLKATPMGLIAENSLKTPGQIGHAIQPRVVQPEVTIENPVVEPAYSQGEWDQHDDTHRIGHLLFTTYVAPFEITSLLILVAAIGVVVLCKQDKPRRPSPSEGITRLATPTESKEEALKT